MVILMDEEWTQLIPEGAKSQIFSFIIRETKNYLNDVVWSKIKSKLEEKPGEVASYYSLVELLKESLPNDKFLEIIRELSKAKTEFEVAYRKYLKETVTEEQENWYETYGLEENPFDFVSGIRDWRLFVGYEKERKIINERILHKKGKGGILSVHGVPLIGKTSFLIYMDEAFTSEGIVVSRIMRPSTSSTDFLKSVLDEIIKKDERAIRSPKQKLTRILFENKISEVSSLLKASRPWSSVLFSKLEEICKENAEKLFLIIVDESHDMKGETVKYFLKCLTIKNTEVLMSQRDKIHPDEEIDAKTGIKVELTGITKNDAIELIRRYLSSCRKGGWEGEEFEPFEKSALNLIFRYSLIRKGAIRANPGSVVKLCHESINLASLKGSLVNDEIINSSAKSLGLSPKEELKQLKLDS
jgi:hypothetical protein